MQMELFKAFDRITFRYICMCADKKLDEPRDRQI